MCHLLHVGEDPLARQAAVELGIAMQLTNILRDIGEDMDAGRMYLPADELAACGSSAEHLRWLRRRVVAHGPSAIDDGFRRLMHAQVQRARSHYARGRDGIPRLPSHAQLAIALAARSYEGILDAIEAAQYDVFSERAATSTTDKLRYAVQCWVWLRLRGRFRLTPFQPEGAHL
jgi:phytoene synthase